MNARSLIGIFPALQDLASVSPEDLGAVIVELAPGMMQNGMFNIDSLTAQLYQLAGPSYERATQRQATNILAEALSWLISQGLLFVDPEQPAPWYRLTRRASSLRTRADVDAYVKGRIIPADLVSDEFERKVIPLFRRGDYDVAVFQAFKELEVATRRAANAKGAGYPDDRVGTKLMRDAFNPETGPLTDPNLVLAEREAEAHLFSGAIGYAKNPAGHRDFEVTAVEAAQLIIFASYLFAIVQRRLG